MSRNSFRRSFRQSSTGSSERRVSTSGNDRRSPVEGRGEAKETTRPFDRREASTVGLGERTSFRLSSGGNVCSTEGSERILSTRKILCANGTRTDPTKIKSNCAARWETNRTSRDGEEFDETMADERRFLSMFRDERSRRIRWCRDARRRSSSDEIFGGESRATLRP